MQLIGRYDSPYVRRVGVTLHVLHLPFHHLSLSPFSQASQFRQHAAIGRMPVLVLDDGETLIESAAILEHLDEVAGPARALMPAAGPERRKSLQILARATAACDKAIAISYERRRPAEKVFDAWIERCRSQLSAALAELDSFRLELTNSRVPQQIEITSACTYAYVNRVAPDVVTAGRYPWLERLSSVCEMRPQFLACPQ
jgi:glutathione S-transferase